MAGGGAQWRQEQWGEQHEGAAQSAERAREALQRARDWDLGSGQDRESSMPGNGASRDRKHPVPRQAGRQLDEGRESGRRRQIARDRVEGAEGGRGEHAGVRGESPEEHRRMPHEAALLTVSLMLTLH